MNYYDALSKALKVIRSCETEAQLWCCSKILKNLRNRYEPASSFSSNYFKIWDDALKDHLSTAGKNDEVVQYVNEILRNKACEQANEEADYKSSKEYEEERAKEIQRFYDQFKPRKR